MNLSNKTYDIIKYLALVGLPAVATFVAAIGVIWGFDYTDQVVKSIVAFSTLLGALTVVNKAVYNRSDAKYDGEIQYEATPPGTDDNIVHIDLGPTVTQAVKQGEVLMKMVPRRAG